MTLPQIALFDLPTCVIAGCKRAATVGRVCAEHFVELDVRIGEIGRLFDRLEAEPAGPIETVPQKPSFESKSPASDHHIALRDVRSYGGPLWVMQKWQIAFWQTKTSIVITPTKYSDGLIGSMTLHWPYWAESDYASDFFVSMTRIWRDLALAVGEIVLERPVGICECGSMIFWRERVVCDRCGNSYSEIAHIALRRAVLTYALRNAPFWKKLVRESK